MGLRPAYGDGFAGVGTPGGIIYVKGDATTEGSLRLVPDVLGENVEMQRRMDGVWNDTGIQIAASTVHLGRELQISGAGGHVRTYETNSDILALLPDIPFTHAAGTGFPHASVLGPILTRVVVQSDESAEVVGTDLQSTYLNSSRSLTSKVYMKVGSVAATKPVTVTFRRESISGSILWQRNFPASMMAMPNVEFEVDLVGMVEAEANEQIHVQLASTAPMSLKTNAAQTNVWIALNFHLLAEEELLQDNLLLSNDAGIIFTNDGNLITADYEF